MAIAFDAVGTANTDSATPWSTSGSHTAANSNADTLVLVCGQFLGTSTITPENAARTVTYGGANCDFVGYSYVGTPATGGFNVFYAKWAPAAGAQTVAVSVTPSAGGPVILRTNTVSYTGVGAIGEIFASAGASTTPSVVATSATGRTLVHLGSVAGTTLTSYSQTARYTNTTTHSMVIGDAAGASSVTFSYTSGNQIWGNAVIELLPSPDSGVVREQAIAEGSLTTGSSASLAGSTTIQVSASDANTKILAGVVQSVSTNSASTTCSVTCGGSAMTQEYYLAYGSTTSRAAIGVYSIVNPGTGAKTIAATSGGTSTKTQIAIGAICYENAGTISASTNAAALALSVSSQTSGRAFYVGANGAAISAPTQIERYLYGGAPAGVGSYILVQDAPGSTTVSFSATGTATTPQSAGVSVAPAATGVVVTPSAASLTLTGSTPTINPGIIVSPGAGYEAAIDFSTKGTVAMPSVMDTGQAVDSTYSPNSTANATIVSGRYVCPYVSAGSGASYLTLHPTLANGEITYMRATFKKTGSGATDGWGLGLVSWTQQFPTGALISGAVDSPCHLAFSNTGWTYSWYDATLGLQNIQSRTYSPTIDHTVDHTVSVLIDKSSNKATVTGADGVPVDVTDSHIGSKTGNYACCEIFYGAGNTDKRLEVADFKTTSRVAGGQEPTRLTLVGAAPTVTVAANRIVQPAAAALTLTGAAPTLAVSNKQLVTPSGATLTLTAAAPAVTATDAKTLTPTAAALALSGFAPAVGVSNKQTVTPAAAALTLSGAAPTVSVPVAVTPAATTLTLTGSAAAVTISNNQTATPTSAALALTGQAPTVRTPVAVTPAAAALAITAAAPAVAVTANRIVQPTAAALTLTGALPDILAGGSLSPSPAAAALTLTGAAPTVALTAKQIVTPGAAALILTAAAPTVTATDLKTVIPAAAALTLTGAAPVVTVTDKKTVAPAAAALTLTGQTPTVTVGASITVTPTAATSTLTGAAPAVTVTNNKLITPAATTLTLTGSAPRLISPLIIIPAPAVTGITGWAPYITVALKSPTPPERVVAVAAVTRTVAVTAVARSIPISAVRRQI